MKIAIISGGDIQETFASGFLSEYQADMLIAADRGLDFCLKSGYLPDLVVGDFDSLEHSEVLSACGAEDSSALWSCSKEQNTAAITSDSTHTDTQDCSLASDAAITICGKAVRVLRHRPEKDATDTELAVAQAVECGASEICLLGATGTRLDHVWGNLSLLCRLREKQISGWIVDAYNRISMPFEQEIMLSKDGQFGTYVSIFPYGGPVEGLTLKGFHYPLEDFTLEPGTESLCVSNEIDEETAQIRYESGILVIIESRDH